MGHYIRRPPESLRSALTEEGQPMREIPRPNRNIGRLPPGFDTDRPFRPNVDSDRRVPATDAEPEGSLDNVKSKPLGIQQIEELEDDAKGG
jgi:hypothetical protein